MKVHRMSKQLVTANRLHDGAVVYLTINGGWTTNVESGFVSNKKHKDELMVMAKEAVDAQLIIAPYLIDVEVVANSIRPRRFRESIRAKGPTIFSTMED